MKTQTALNHRTNAARRINDLYRRAKHFHMDSATLFNESRAIRETISHCPVWVTAYVEGVESVLRESLYPRQYRVSARYE